MTSEWWNQAECRRSDLHPDTWFAEGDPDIPKEQRTVRELRAKLVCASCPVRTECLTEALERNERDGIWGGLTTSERDALSLGGRVVGPTVISQADLTLLPVVQRFAHTGERLSDAVEWGLGVESDRSVVSDVSDRLTTYTYRIEGTA